MGEKRQGKAGRQWKNVGVLFADSNAGFYDNDQILCECEGLGRFDEATFEMVTFLRFAVRLC